MKIKRCKETAPLHPHLRCELERNHTRALHQSGAIVWTRGTGTLPPLDVTTSMDSHRILMPWGGDPSFVALDGASATQPMPPMSEAEGELRDWWMGLAEDEVDRTVPKAVEYSSTDLSDIGHQLARTAGRVVSDEEAAELGVFFYLQGKLSRWAGAIAHGKRPSDDTIFDIGVYCRMAQRIRHAGGWPGTDEENDE